MMEHFLSKMKEIPLFKPKAQIVGMLNMVEQLNKAPTNVSLWDVVSIPEQKTLLQEALKVEEQILQVNVTQLCNQSKNDRPEGFSLRLQNQQLMQMI